MILSADNVLSEREALDWGKFLAVDDSGEAFVFKKRPQKLEGFWMTREFSTDMSPSCFKTEGDYNSGSLYKKEKDDEGPFWYELPS